MATKQLFKLKAGSHSVGGGIDARVYNAADPKNNIIQSEENLAEWDPLKFERYEGPVPDRNTGSFKEDPAPLPTTDEARADALLASQPKTTLQKMELAERLRQQADQLEEEASNEEKAQAQAAKRNKNSRRAADTEDEESEDEPKELADHTKAQLMQLAKDEELDVELKEHMSKEEMVSAIEEARKK